MYLLLFFNFFNRNSNNLQGILYSNFEFYNGPNFLLSTIIKKKMFIAKYLKCKTRFHVSRYLVHTVTNTSKIYIDPVHFYRHFKFKIGRNYIFKQRMTI